MTHLATVSSKYQISLPKALRERLSLKPGDHLSVEERDGHLVLAPVATVPKGQLYFWSKRWQAGEAQAERDIAAGRVSRPHSQADVEGMTEAMLKAKGAKTSRRTKP